MDGRNDAHTQLWSSRSRLRSAIVSAFGSRPEQYRTTTVRQSRRHRQSRRTSADVRSCDVRSCLACAIFLRVPHNAPVRARGPDGCGAGGRPCHATGGGPARPVCNRCRPAGSTGSSRRGRHCRTDQARQAGRIAGHASHCIRASLPAGTVSRASQTGASAQAKRAQQRRAADVQACRSGRPGWRGQTRSTKQSHGCFSQSAALGTRSWPALTAW